MNPHNLQFLDNNQNFRLLVQEGLRLRNNNRNLRGYFYFHYNNKNFINITVDIPFLIVLFLIMLKERQRSIINFFIFFIYFFNTFFIRKNAYKNYYEIDFILTMKSISIGSLILNIIIGSYFKIENEYDSIFVFMKNLVYLFMIAIGYHNLNKIRARYIRARRAYRLVYHQFFYYSDFSIIDYNFSPLCFIFIITSNYLSLLFYLNIKHNNISEYLLVYIPLIVIPCLVVLFALHYIILCLIKNNKCKSVLSFSVFLFIKIYLIFFSGYFNYSVFFQEYSRSNVILILAFTVNCIGILFGIIEICILFNKYSKYINYNNRLNNFIRNFIN